MTASKAQSQSSAVQLQPRPAIWVESKPAGRGHGVRVLRAVTLDFLDLAEHTVSYIELTMLLGSL